MIRILSISAILALFIHAAFAQTTEKTIYAKVKVGLENKSLQQLAILGVETDHGFIVQGRYIINDYSREEIKIIKDAGFPVDILIPDAEAYYANPDRPSELSGISHKRSGCTEATAPSFPVTRPVSYTDGSMAGYHTYQEMLDMLDAMRARYPNLISSNYSIDSIPTHRGNFVFYIRISDEPYIHNTNKPQVLYTALHHAREPNSLSQMLYFMWYLLENYENNVLVQKLLRETQLIFVPCINPDGYKINETNNPNGGGLWRKNARLNENGELRGVDLNRNYGYFWGFNDSGSSPDETSQVYRGPAPFSEPETRAIKALCETFRFTTALNYHSFGNLIIHPWGYNNLPTDEDNIFKNLGRAMNQYNEYKIGTAIETVGYTVNGSSDDWMYGDNTIKNPVYAFTPEVGYSFWPSPLDIEKINEASLWMNIFTALVTRNYYEVKPVLSNSYLTKDNLFIDIQAKRIGLLPGSVQISLQSATPGVSVTTPSNNLSLALDATEIIRFELDVNPSADYPDGITLELLVNHDGVEEKTTIKKYYQPGSWTSVYSNAMNSLDGLNTSGFVVFEEEYFSPPACLKESAFASTPISYEALLEIAEPFDLRDTKTALLQFYTKWDIEASYDYAVVEASANGVDFYPVCGLYTRPGSTDQLVGEPLYDGIQSDWVREQADLSPFIGEEKVWIRFRVKTDEFLSGKGWLIDDVGLLQVSESLTTTEQKSVMASLRTTLTDGFTPLDIIGNDVSEQLFLSLHNAMGAEVLFEPVINAQVNPSPYQLPTGLYFYSIWNQNKTARNTGKLLIVK